MNTDSGPIGVWATLREAASFEVLASCAIGFLAISAVSVTGPVLGQIQSHFVLPYATLGLVGSLFGLARLAMDLPAGYLAGRIDERVLTGFGLALLAGGSLLAVLAATYGLLLLARVLMGIGQSVASTTNLIWISNTARPRVRTTAMAMYQTGLVSALALFPLLSGVLGQRYGWQAAFAVSGAAALLGLGVVGLALARGHAAHTAAPAAARAGGLDLLRQLGRTRLLGLLALYACVFLLMFTSAGFVGTVVPLYGHDVLQLDSATIGVALAVASLVGLAVTLPGGAWADRYGPLRILLPSLGGIVLGSLAFLLVRNTASFVGAAAIVGVYSVGSSVPAALIAQIAPADRRGPAMGIYRVAGDLGVLSGPLILTWAIGAAGYPLSLLISAAVAALVIAAAWFFIRPCLKTQTQ